MKRTEPFAALNLFLGLLMTLTVLGCGKGPLYSISGQVTVAGLALSGVTITLTGKEGRTATTDAGGNYFFGDMPIGTYLLTPSLTGYNFVPSARPVYLDGINATAFNFVATIDGKLATSIHTVCVRGDGTIWTWGNNSSGQLGDGTAIDRASRVQVAALSGMRAVDAGEDHTVALKSDGTVWTWGNNSNGQLGNGTTTNSSIPVQVTGLSTTITAVSAGYDHVLSLKNDGMVWAWGSNTRGQLGNGTTTDSSVPVQVTGLTSVIAVAAGNDFNLALLTDLTIRVWGSNSRGQLGTGTTTDSSTAVTGSGLASVAAIAAGDEHAVALKSDGTVWAWGSNGNGQLGNGTTTDSTTPVQVTGLSGGVAVAAGRNDSAVIRNDNTFWAWGSNSNGQLGDGTTTDRWIPVQAP